MVRYNKLALKMSIEPKPNLTDQKMETKPGFVPASQLSAVNAINKMLYEENQSLIEKLSKLAKEKDIIEGKALVNEQMYE